MQGISKLIAGDSLDFTTEVAKYPADEGWTLKYRLVPRFTSPAQAPITLTATTYETSGYRVQLDTTSTAAWAAGVYSWASWVEKTGQRVTLEQGGELTVAPDPNAITAGTDLRSDAEVALAAIKALIKGKATTGQEHYQINGRELRSYPLPDLIRLQSRLEREVNAERAAAGLEKYRGGIQPIYTRSAAA